MGKAEDKALKAYPKMSRITEPHGVIPADNISHFVGDANAERREGFIEGYLQAEKDLALTYKDVARIFVIATKLTVENTTPMTDKEFYQEILKRFNEMKANEKE